MPSEIETNGGQVSTTSPGELAQEFQHLIEERQKIDAKIEAIRAEYVTNAERLGLELVNRKKPRKKRARHTEE